MCNHYRKDQKVIEWSVSRIPRVRIPVPVEPVGLWPSVKWPVFVSTPGTSHEHRSAGD